MLIFFVLIAIVYFGSYLIFRDYLTVNVAKVSTYILAFMSIIGWVLFALFGGTGICVLPFDLIMDFKHRPKPIKPQVFIEKRQQLLIVMY